MMFSVGDKIQHRKGGQYTIVLTPLDRLVIEATSEAAYAYRGDSGTLWVRSKTETEDGRFTLGWDET